MQITYDETEDVLVLRIGDQPIAREASQDWHTVVSYAADGTVVEVVVLNASTVGAWPLHRVPQAA
ncbi:MAG: DUF2283 domain-containing protein [Proteobacteria bacterium]|nr:DUF2283 domain-containing protein [Pseudomonadota bacterium]